MKDLVTIGCDAAMRGAVEYLRANDLKANVDALVPCLRSWVKAKFPEALHDAKEAFDAGMSQVALTTFCASMALAGIEAAKEASVPPVPV